LYVYRYVRTEHRQEFGERKAADRWGGGGRWVEMRETIPTT
jgi:hypothetical protein